MANNKWTKWCVGVSSAALFVGLIGLNASHSDAANPSSSPMIIKEPSGDRGLKTLTVMTAAPPPGPATMAATPEPGRNPANSGG